MGRVKELATSLNVSSSENGKLAFIDFDRIVCEILNAHPGKLGMPQLSSFDAKSKVNIVISRDATGKGNLQFTTIAARSPWSSKSAQLLHIFGFGCCGDNRDGTRRLLGSYLQAINQMISDAVADIPVRVNIRGEEKEVHVQLYFTDDVCALRHGEHMANSGWCGCSRDKALRQIPQKPATVQEMKELVDGAGTCRELSCLEREILSHTPPEGEVLPRPCIAPGCKFGHGSQSSVEDEYKELLEQEEKLSADKSKKGQRAFSQWRMQHAWKGPAPHFNVPPGLYGRPLLRHHLRYQILDALHLAVLGLPKTPFKYGIKSNCSDDALDRISEQLALWKHPLDVRRKEDGRINERKWFSGEKWHTFCAGKGGSPGGPIAIATLVMIVADDLQFRGADSGNTNGDNDDDGQTPNPILPSKPAPKKGRSRAAYASRMAASASADKAVPAADVSEAEHEGDQQLEEQPTEFEAASNQDAIKVFKRLYGSRARTILNALLAFDAYFAWFYPLKKSVPYLCSQETREERALDNCRRAIDMQAQFERVSMGNHGSFLPHGAVFKMSRDILQIGDVWAHDLSAVELQQAESKRVFESGGSRHLEFATAGRSRKKDSEGHYRLINTKGYGSTAATSTLTKLLAIRVLREGDGAFSTPESRRSERLFGENGQGRSKPIKLEDGRFEQEYDPACDTCVDAFVRLLAARTEAERADPA